MKEYATDITQRFLLIKDEVIREGLVNTAKEFATAIGEHSQNFTKMEKGTRSPTLDQVARACEIYGYSPTWVILNKGSKKLDKKAEVPLEKRVDQLEQQMRKLKKHVAI